MLKKHRIFSQCDLVTEKCFVLRYDKATIKKDVAQFSFGFYSLMLTSLLLGLIVMVLYWISYLVLQKKY